MAIIADIAGTYNRASAPKRLVTFESLKTEAVLITLKLYFFRNFFFGIHVFDSYKTPAGCYPSSTGADIYVVYVHVMNRQKQRS